MTTYILGAGPAGLALALELAESRAGPFILLEAQSQPGGMAQTLTWSTHGKHDLGPHKLFSTDPSLTHRVLSWLPNDQWITHPKISRIFLSRKIQSTDHFRSQGSNFFVRGPVDDSPVSTGESRLTRKNQVPPLYRRQGQKNYVQCIVDESPVSTGESRFKGQFLPYPPSLTSLIRLLGPRRCARAAWEYLRAPGGPGDNFEDDLIRRAGPTLYDTLFKPMALKIWGDPTRQDGQLARDRVQLPSLKNWARRGMGFGNTGSFEARTFRYPKGGLQSLWSALVRRSTGSGSFLFNHRVVALAGDPQRVTAITATNGNQRVSFPVGPDDFVFSTLPLRDLGGLFHESDPSFLEDLRAATPAHTLNLVFLKIKGPPGFRLLKENWVFVPDLDFPFHRVSESGAFDPDLVPQGSILCCEIMGGPHRPDSTLSAPEQINHAVDGLRRMGYRFDLEDAKRIRLESSYPIVTEESRTKRGHVLDRLDRSENLRVVGRSGAFQYIGTLDALDVGFGAARWRAAGSQPDTWKQERLRTSRYPIYD